MVILLILLIVVVHALLKLCLQYVSISWFNKEEPCGVAVGAYKLAGELAMMLAMHLPNLAQKFSLLCVLSALGVLDLLARLSRHARGIGNGRLVLDDAVVFLAELGCMRIACRIR